MRTETNPFLKKKAFEFYLKGNSQKAVANRFKITEKTAASWLKDLKEKYKKNSIDIKILNEKLDLLLTSSKPNTNDIKNITQSIKNLESVWFNKTIKD